jgi:hypothetical protein
MNVVAHRTWHAPTASATRHCSHLCPHQAPHFTTTQQQLCKHPPCACAAGMTRFWIMELQGRKLVRLVPPSENAAADPSDIDTFQPTLFTADLMAPNFDKHPGLDGMLVYEALLEPGDVLFIPEGWGHQALNLEWSLMISSNYIDQHNAHNYLELKEFDEVRLLLFALTEE